MKIRNHGVVATIGRKSGAFKDKRQGRGGARNEERELLVEYQEDLANNGEWGARLDGTVHQKNDSGDK